MADTELLEQPTLDEAQPEPQETPQSFEQSQPEERPGTSDEQPLSFVEAIRKKIKADEKSEATEQPKDSSDQTPPKTPKSKKSKKQDTEREDFVDPMKLAEAQGREIARTLADEMRPKSAPEPEHHQSQEDLASELPEEYQADIAVYQEMARTDPRKYGQILKKLQTAAKAETDYISTWEKDNSGQDYDPDDADHKAFYKKHFPEIPSKDFDAAKESILETRIQARLESRYEAKLDAMERERAADKASPAISEHVGSMVREVLTQIDSSLADAVQDSAKLAALEESHPIAAEALLETHQRYSPLLSANIELHRGISQFDSDNPAHMGLYKLAQDIEAETSAAPLEHRMDSQGRVFATREAYQNMTEREQAKHWIVDEHVIAYVVGKKASTFGKQAYENRLNQFKKWVKSQLGTKSSASNTTPTGKQAQPPKAQKELETEDSAASPSVPGSGQVPSPWSSNGDSNKKPADYFLDYLKRR